MSHRSPITLVVAGVLLLNLQAGLRSEVRLPHAIGSHMVMQRDLAAPVWGWASPGEEVVVAIAGQEAKATADASGRWMMKLKPTAAGGPHEMVVRGKNEIRLEDILFGDVWICSGQSNMRWQVLSSTGGKEALAKADLSQIRLLQVPLRASGQPVEDVDAEWKVCSPTTAARFSAVGFYFGRELNQELGVPIGLIDSAWSGSRIDPWIAPEGFASIAEYPDLSAKLAAHRERWKAELLPWAIAQGEGAAAMRAALEKGTPLPITPTWPIDSTEMNRRHQYTAGREAEIYNGMIYPLVPLGLRGAIWYQGESNTRAWPLIDYALPDGDMTYATKTRALINGWRKVWGQGDFPVYFVQICPFHEFSTEDITALWEAQTAAMAIENTGMVVTTDVAEPMTNVHPPRKAEVGQRLALWALAKTYGKDVVYSGPLYKAMSVAGGKVRLTFDHVDGGLAARDGKALDWFTIAGDDRVFVPATAEIEGETIVVSSDKVAKPAAVRFGWNNLAQPNLINKAGLPASPFRTDRWNPPAPVHKPAAEAAKESAAFLAANAAKAGVVTLPSGVQYVVVKDGDGTIPKLGNQVSIVYRATLIDGTVFDATTEEVPATPRVEDAMRPIQEVLLLLKAGSVCQVVIPPAAAYGEAGFGKWIGPNAVLVYELEFKKIVR